MNIENLKAAVMRRGGLARANRFSMLVIPPTQAFDTIEQVRD